MKIDYEKLENKFWFEDSERNKVSKDDPKACYYRHSFPLEIHEYLDEYCYHPKNPIIKFLCRKSRRFHQWVGKGKGKTFKTILDCRTTWGGGQDVVLAMANSGDFTLEQAIWVYANSCERCMNVLAHKYLNETEGYEEYSEEWEKCGTVCDFCREEK